MPTHATQEPLRQSPVQVANKKSAAPGGHGLLHGIAQSINDSPRQVSQAAQLASMFGQAIYPIQRAGTQMTPLNAVQGNWGGKSVLQRYVEPLDGGSGWERYVVAKNDLGTGTGTTNETREYVNGGMSPPSIVGFKYKGKGQSFEGPYTVDNPLSDVAYKSGKYWDAGHKLGRQNGGCGSETWGVFPQTPSINQGNTKNLTDEQKQEYWEDIDENGGDTMRSKWRQHEDNFKELVTTYNGGEWWIKLV